MTLSPVQQMAQELYDAGFNVFPQPYAESGILEVWQLLQRTRIHRDQIPQVFVGRCNIAVLTGHTSGNLCIIDCETNAAFDKYQQHVSARLPDVWKVKTPFGGQLWFRVAGERCIENTRLDQDTVVYGHDEYVLIPPSKSEMYSTFDWLKRTGKNPPTIHNPSVLSLPGIHLTEYKQKQKPKRQEEPNYIQELRTLAIVLGWSDEKLKDEIDLAKKAHLKSAKAIPHWQAAAAYLAKNWRWEGKHGISDLAIIKSIIDVIRHTEAKLRTFSVSYRQLSEMSVVETATVQQSMKRLQMSQPPVLERLKDKIDPIDDEIWFYKFSDKVVRAGRELLRNGYGNATYTWMITDSLRYLDFAHDVLASKALGHDGMLVFSTVQEAKNPIQLKEIASLTGFPRSIVKSRLKTLREQGLLLLQNKHHYTVAPFDSQQWHQIAVAMGVLGKQEALKQKYIIDRQKKAGQKIIAWRQKRDAHNLYGS